MKFYIGASCLLASALIGIVWWLAGQPATRPAVPAPSRPAIGARTGSVALLSPESFFLREGCATEGREIAGTPGVRTFVNDAGEIVRTLQLDAMGRILKDMRFRAGQSFAVERVYAEDGNVLREKFLRNGWVVQETARN